MTDFELLLAKRFAALGNPLDDSDWAAVAGRARQQSRIRWLLLAAVLTLVGVLVATPALGLRGKLVRLFESGEPAPERVVEDFASLDIGAPPGMAPGVVAGSARKVLEVRVGPDENAILWVAPTQSGGYCKLVELRREGKRNAGGGGGCDRNREIAVSPGLVIPGPISPQGEILRGPVLIDGTILLRPAASVRLVMADGARLSIPLVRVSEPIDAAFFVYSLPRRHWRPGHQPKALIVLDRDGHELARDGKFFALPLFGNPGLCANAPCEAVRSRKRRVIQDHDGEGNPGGYLDGAGEGRRYLLLAHVREERIRRRLPLWPAPAAGRIRARHQPGRRAGSRGRPPFGRGRSDCRRCSDPVPGRYERASRLGGRLHPLRGQICELRSRSPTRAARRPRRQRHRAGPPAAKTENRGTVSVLKSCRGRSRRINLLVAGG